MNNKEPMVHEIREKISAKIPRCDVVVSTFPVETVGSSDSSMVKDIMTKKVKTLNNDY